MLSSVRFSMTGRCGYHLERKTVFVLLCFQRHPHPCADPLLALYLQNHLGKSKHVLRLAVSAAERKAARTVMVSINSYFLALILYR